MVFPLLLLCSLCQCLALQVKVYIDGPINELGWVMDFSQLKIICAPHISLLDHSYLNEIDGLDNPTSENIAIWLWSRLIKELPQLSTIEIMETRNSGCSYSG